MIPLSIYPVPLLEDNYAYVLRSERITAVVDPSEGEPVWNFLKEKGWNLDFIFNTHHHWDHVGGNGFLKQKSHCRVITSKFDHNRIEGADDFFGPTFRFGEHTIKIFDIPGHTLGHVALWFENADSLFSGDTLFSLGCGRLFEGTPEQMWNSLSKLRGLPDTTRIYCGHEYTTRNCEFALSIEPASVELQNAFQKFKQARTLGEMTIPALMSFEKRFNPFLRSDEPGMKKRLGFSAEASPSDVFAHLRKLKDKF